jgi:hypothetical protein
MQDILQDIFSGDPDELLTEDKAAVLLRCKVGTLASKRAKGQGSKYIKDGRFIWYTRRFLREHIQSRVVTPEPATVRRQRKALAAEAASTPP